MWSVLLTRDPHAGFSNTSSLHLLVPLHYLLPWHFLYEFSFTGRLRREFMCVDDLADAAVFCLEHWQPTATPADPEPLEHLNVGTGTDISIRDLAERVAAAVGFKGEILWDTGKPDGTPRKLLDVSRLAALGWQASISLQAGLKRTVAEYVSDVAAGVAARL